MRGAGKQEEGRRPCVIITGASSGIGLATAQLYLNRGWEVYNFSRRPGPVEDLDPTLRGRLHHKVVDLRSRETIERAVTEVLAEQRRVDLVISNAGYGIAGAIEETGEEDYLAQYDVNVFGALRLVQVLLPVLRRELARQPKAGDYRPCLLFVSSLAAVLPIPYQAFYSATKSSLVSLVRCLKMECRDVDIRISVLCPGDVSTGFTAHRQTLELRPESPYYQRQLRSIQRMEKDERAGKPASYVAQALYRLSQKRRPKSCYVLGFSYRCFYLLAQILPLRLADFILAKLYA